MPITFHDDNIAEMVFNEEQKKLITRAADGMCKVLNRVNNSPAFTTELVIAALSMVIASAVYAKVTQNKTDLHNAYADMVATIINVTGDLLELSIEEAKSNGEH